MSRSHVGVYGYGNSREQEQPSESFAVVMKTRPDPIYSSQEVDLFRSLLATSTQFQGLLDTNGQLLEMNQTALDFSGLSRAEVMGQTFWHGPWWQTEKDRQAIRAMTEEALLGRLNRSELEVLGRGHSLWVEVVLRPIRNALGAIIMVLVEGNDISQRKWLEQTLRESEEQHRLVIEAMSEGVVQFEVDGKISMCNKAAERILGRSREQILGRKQTSDWLAIREDGTPLERDDPNNPTAKTFRTGQSQSNFVMGIHKPTSELTWVLVNTQPLKHNHETSPYAVLATLTDITQQKTLENNLRQAALYDALTCLPTRTLLMERLTQAVARHKRDTRTTFALLFIDLDNFKTVNDTLGHAAGDAVLVEVAKRLKSSVRGTDTAARLGGDEFLVLLEGLDSEETARHFAKRISSTLTIMLGTAPHTIEVRASIGIAHYDGTLTANELLTQADKAMYRAKATGKGHVTMW